MRKENWPTLLSDFIKLKMDQPFIWGQNDCCLFAADAVLELTGIDYAQNYRGIYQTEEAALQFVNDAGGMQAILDLNIGQDKRIYVTQAQRGDVVLMHGCAAIVDDSGRRAAIYIKEKGLCLLPFLKDATAAWRIE